MTTLFDATLQVARALGELKMGTADSGGTTTTLVDSNIGGDDDDWNGGTLWHIDDSEFSEISDYTESSGTVSLLDALTSATADGDRYAIADKEYPLNVIIDAVNQELTMTRYPKTDTSTITIADEQTEYDLPSDCDDLRQVYYEVEEDSNKHLWTRFPNWDVQKTSTGSADKLIINWHGIASDYDLKLVYVTYHSAVYNDDDNIDESIPLARIVPAAVRNLMLRNLQDMNTADEAYGNFINMWEQRAERAKLRHPIRLPARDGKVMALGTSDQEAEVEEP